MKKKSKKFLQNPGRRVFLALGGLMIAGYYFSGKSLKEGADPDQSAENPVTSIDPDAVTVDSTRISVGANDY